MVGLALARRRAAPARYASRVSKAFTKDDRPDEPVVVRHRPALPDGVPNYVTARGLQALRDQLAAAELAARRTELEQRIAAAVPAPAPADREEIRFGARAILRSPDGELRQMQIVGVDEADPAAGLVAFVAPLARALLGRRVGDRVTVRTPGGDEEIEVLSVDYEVA
jgi:transcription elongation factor GreB